MRRLAALCPSPVQTGNSMFPRPTWPWHRTAEARCPRLCTRYGPTVYAQNRAETYALCRCFKPVDLLSSRGPRPYSSTLGYLHPWKECHESSFSQPHYLPHVCHPHSIGAATTVRYAYCYERRHPASCSGRRAPGAHRGGFCPGHSSLPQHHWHAAFHRTPTVGERQDTAGGQREQQLHSPANVWYRLWV